MVNVMTTARACELDAQPATARYLIDPLWGEEAVGVIGALPKSSKSWLTLEMAIAVATGTPCLGRFPVSRPGPVLLYAAEDSLAMVRERLEGLCRHRGVKFRDLEVHVITEPVIRLDRDEDRRRLSETVSRLQPRLLILDPLVRICGRLDENVAGEVAAFLAYLRGLQRAHRLALILVHHARKAQVKGASVGQALRGSGDIYAWVDTLLYLRRHKDGIDLHVEHRSAPSPEPIGIRLVVNSTEAPHLELTSAASREVSSPADRVLALLSQRRIPTTNEELRRLLKMRKERVIEIIATLEAAHQITRLPKGWVLKDLASLPAAMTSASTDSSR